MHDVTSVKCKKKDDIFLKFCLLTVPLAKTLNRDNKCYSRIPSGRSYEQCNRSISELCWNYTRDQQFLHVSYLVSIHNHMETGLEETDL